jgi:hypothetical protein
MAIIDEILDGMDVNATDEQQAHGKEVIDAQNPVAFHSLLQRWGTSKDRIKKHKASLVAGFVLISCNADRAVPEQETVPPNAPESIDRVLGKNGKAKLFRLASTFYEKCSQDFFCHHNWPKFDGIFITMNDIAPKASGTESSERKQQKKRKKTHVTLLSASNRAIERFNEIFQPDIDEDQYNYHETTNHQQFYDRTLYTEEELKLVKRPKRDP